MKIFKHQEEYAQIIWENYKNGIPGNVLGFEQGLGKTLTVFRFLELAELNRVLVLCPSIARQEWRRQLQLFYPEWENKIFISSDSKEVSRWQEGDRGIFVTGYNPKLTAHIQGCFDVVVADECQEISNPDVVTSALVRGIIDRSENTFFLGMSGTPSMDRIEQIWNIANLCCPGEFGQNLGWFKVRYLQKIANEWAPKGFVYKGLREDRRQELERKIDGFMHRLRKQDVASDLPPLTISLRYIKPKRSKLDWNDPGCFDQLLQLNSAGRIDATVDLVKEGLDNGQTKFVIFTYLRETASVVAERLAALGIVTEKVTGDIPADKRHIPIERVRQESGPSALVATIDSVGVAVDFTFCQTAVFCESHWQPGATSQALGRLHRLSSTHPVSCYFVVCEGSPEEKKAGAFVRKMAELEAVMRSGTAENDARKALQSSGQSDKDILEEMF